MPGGSITTGRKLKSVQELEEHGEAMVKIAKVKPKPKAKKTLTVTKATPELVPLLFLEDLPGEGPRRSRRKKDSDKKDKKDDDRLEADGSLSHQVKPKLKFVT